MIGTTSSLLQPSQLYGEIGGEDSGDTRAMPERTWGPGLAHTPENMQGLICLRTAPSLVVESAVHRQRVHCSGDCNYFHSPTSGHYVGHQFNALLTSATQDILSKRSFVSQACSSLEENIMLLRTSSQRDVDAVSGAAVIPLPVSRPLCKARRGGVARLPP